MNKKIASVIGAAGLATSIFFMGCGGSTVDPVVALFSLKGVLTDGPISNAEVQLATLKRGAVTAPAITNDKGEYTLTVARSFLEELNDDVPYLYASSTASSQVMTNTTNDRADLVPGQVSFRSILTVESLRQVASTTKTDFGTAEIEGLKISHETNATALIVESKLLARGAFKAGEQLTPNSFNGKTIDGDVVNKLANETASVKNLISDTSTFESKLWIGLGIATQQLVEEGNAEVFTGVTGTKALTNAAALLFEAATAEANKVTLNTATFDYSQALTKFATGTNNATLEDKILRVSEGDVAAALNEDKKIAKHRLSELLMDLSGVESTYMTTDSSHSLVLTLDVSGNVPKYSSADSGVVVSFVHDGLTLKLNEINGIVFDADISEPKTGENTGIGATAAVTVTLSAPVESVAGSDLLTKGEFFKLEVSNGTNDYVLWLGRIDKVGQNIGLGLVGFENLNNSDGKFWLKSASMPYEGGTKSVQVLPFTTSALDIALPCGNLAYDAACTFEVGYSVPEAKVETWSYYSSTGSTPYTTVLKYLSLHYDVAASGVFKGTRESRGDYSELRVANGDLSNEVIFRYAKDSFWYREQDGSFTPIALLPAFQPSVAFGPNATQSTIATTLPVLQEQISLDWTGDFTYTGTENPLGVLAMVETTTRVGVGQMFMHPDPQAKPVYFKVNGTKYTPAKYSTTHLLPTSGPTLVFERKFSSEADFDSWYKTNSTTDTGILTPTARVSTTYDLSDGDYDVYILRTYLEDGRYVVSSSDTFNYSIGTEATPKYFKLMLTDSDKKAAVGKGLEYKSSVFEPKQLDGIEYRLRIKTGVGDRHFHWPVDPAMFGGTGIFESGYSYLEYVNYPSRVTATTATVVENAQP